jgi:hypothetical protein
VISKDSGHGIIPLRDRIIQRRLPTTSGCTAIDVGAMSDELFGSSPVCVRIAAASRRAPHRHGVQRRCAYDRILIDLGAAVQQ